MEPSSKYFKLVFAALKKNGLLPENDIYLPSVCTLIARSTLRGSWWSHPLSHDIFAVNEQLTDHPDVLLTKLLTGRVTFVHREFWRPLYAIGRAREDWQMKNLSAPAALLLKEIDKLGSLTTSKLKSSFGVKPGDTARDLEKRLLIHAQQFHTARGAHSKMLETWDTWGKRVGVKPHRTPSSARSRIEQRLEQLNKQFGGDARLPWQ